jgi:hypothetical protein
VRATYGVLSLHQNVSKMVVTTTSQFAPGVFDEFKPVMPYRLELKDGQQLTRWLLELWRGGPPSNSLEGRSTVLIEMRRLSRERAASTG